MGKKSTIVKSDSEEKDEPVTEQIPTKPKKILSTSQLNALKKGHELRQANCAKQRQEKELHLASVLEEEKKKKSKKPIPQPQPQPESESEVEIEEQIIHVKKPKKKIIKKIIVEDSSSEEQEEEEIPRLVKEKQFKSQQNKKTIKSVVEPKQHSFKKIFDGFI
jgi:hypothetical protein